jgi:hypothetical protein
MVFRMSSSQTDRYLFDFQTSLHPHVNLNNNRTSRIIPAHEFYAVHYQIAQFAERVIEKLQLYEASIEHVRKELATAQWSINVCHAILHNAETDQKAVEEQRLRRSSAIQSLSLLLSERKQLFCFDLTETRRAHVQSMRAKLNDLIQCQTSIQQRISNAPTTTPTPLASVKPSQAQSYHAVGVRTRTQDAELIHLLQQEAETMFQIVLHQSLTMTSRAMHKQTSLTQKKHRFEQMYNRQKHRLLKWKQFVTAKLLLLQQWWKQYTECDLRIRDLRTQVLHTRAPQVVSASFMHDMITMFSEIQYGTQEWINASQLCQIYTSSRHGIPHILPYQRLFADIFHFHPERTIMNLHSTGTQVMDTVVYTILKTWYYTMRTRKKDAAVQHTYKQPMQKASTEEHVQLDDPEWVDAFILIPQIERIAHWEAKMHMHVNAFNPWSEKSHQDDQIQLLYERLMPRASSPQQSHASVSASASPSTFSSPYFVLLACRRFRHTVVLEYKGGFRCILHPFTSGISKQLMIYLNDSWRVSQQERFRSTYWRTSGSVHASIPCMENWKHPVYLKFAKDYPFQFNLLVQAWREEVSYDKNHVRTSLPAPVPGSMVVVDQVWHVLDMSTVGRDVKSSMTANAWYRTLLLRKQSQAEVFPLSNVKNTRLGVILCNDTGSMHNHYPVAHWMRIIQLLLSTPTFLHQPFPASLSDWPRFHVWKIPQKTQTAAAKTCVDYIMRAEEAFCREYFFDAAGKWRIEKKLLLQAMTSGYVSYYDNGNDKAVIPVAKDDIAGAFHTASISYAQSDASTRLVHSPNVQQSMLLKSTIQRDIIFVPLEIHAGAAKAYYDAHAAEKRKGKISTPQLQLDGELHSDSDYCLYAEQHPLALQRGWGTRMPSNASDSSPLKLCVLEKKLTSLNNAKHLITSTTRRPEYCRDAVEIHFQRLQPAWIVINIQGTIAFLQNTVAATSPTSDPDDERMSECIELWYALHNPQERILCIGFRLLKDKIEQAGTGNYLAFVTSFQIALFNDARNHAGQYIRAIYIDNRALSPVPLTNTYYMHELEPPVSGDGKMQVVMSSMNAMCSITQLQGNQWDIEMKDISKMPLIFTYVSTQKSYEQLQHNWRALDGAAGVHTSAANRIESTTEERLLAHLMRMSRKDDLAWRDDAGNVYGLAIASAIRSVAADCLHHASYHKSTDHDFHCVLPSLRDAHKRATHETASSTAHGVVTHNQSDCMVCLIDSLTNHHIYIKISARSGISCYDVQPDIVVAIDESDFLRFTHDAAYTSRTIRLASGTEPLLLVHELASLLSANGMGEHKRDVDIIALRDQLRLSRNTQDKQQPTPAQCATSLNALTQLFLMCSDRDLLLEIDYLSFLDDHWFVNDNLIMRFYTELLPIHADWIEQVIENIIVPSVTADTHNMFKKYNATVLQYLGAHEQQQWNKNNIHTVLESILLSPRFCQDSNFELPWNDIVPMYTTLTQDANANLTADVHV